MTQLTRSYNEGEEPKENKLDDACKRLRNAWILAVRSTHEKRAGSPSNYNSKPMWDGGVCPRTKRSYKSIWPKIVRIATQNNIDPINLVTMLFSSILDGSTPTPHELIYESNIKKCSEEKKSIERSAPADLNSHEAIFRSAIWAANQSIPDPEAAKRYVLNDIGRTLTPLFRYCVAKICGMEDIAEGWKISALNQYNKYPDVYIRYWKNILPSELMTHN